MPVLLDTSAIIVIYAWLPVKLALIWLPHVHHVILDTIWINHLVLNVTNIALLVLTQLDTA